MNKIVLAIALVLLSSVALAKSPKSTTPPPAQNHSCMLKDAVVEKTKKECLKAGGKWEKNAPAATAPVVAPAAPVVAPAVEPKPIETPTK
ncbi:MAG: hypothetical protein QX189_11305 [Methylococcales bacterium]